MTENGLVLVTGATGRLGSAVCKALLAGGYAVRATDRRHSGKSPTRVEIGDLCDEMFVYRVVEGCDAVVHLGNYPNVFAGPSVQSILSANVAMNANVFLASVHLGIRCLVFSSSIQAMLKTSGDRMLPPYPIPFLPLDGSAPTNPGTNTYALSKEVGERLLQVLCNEHPDLSATAIRYPMLPMDRWVEFLTSTKPLAPQMLNWGEVISFLRMQDAANLVTAVLGRRLLGYHQYFAAKTIRVSNMSVSELVAEHYPNVPLLRPSDEIDDLVDISAIERDVGWVPTQSLEVSVER